jgi:signal peptidase I
LNLPSDRASERPKIKERDTFFREIVELLLLIAAVYTIVNLATSRYVVDGQSMMPNFEGTEYLIVNRFEYMFTDPDRGDIVIFHYPLEPKRDFIKRVIGLPGEEIHIVNGQVFVNGEPLDEPYVAGLCQQSRCQDQSWYLEEDQFFVLGDNRNYSEDSSSFGAVDRKFIVGRAWVKYWPPSEWELIQHHTYNGAAPTLVPSPTPPALSSTPVPPMSESTGG